MLASRDVLLFSRYGVNARSEFRDSCPLSSTRSSNRQNEARLVEHLSRQPRRKPPRHEAHAEARQLAEEARYNRALAAQHRADRGMRHELGVYHSRVRDPRVVALAGRGMGRGFGAAWKTRVTDSDVPRYSS